MATQVSVTPDTVLLRGGVDIVTPPLLGKPGTLRLGINYEGAIGGGYRRIGGLDRYDGRPAPSDASYTLLECSSTPTGVVLGNTLTNTGATVTGKVIYLSGVYIGVTKVVGAFTTGAVKVGATTVATVVDAAPSVDGFLDNALAVLAATQYRLDITKVPGSGRVRGLAMLGNNVYAWRNNAGGTAMAIYKASASGWTEVTLYRTVSFTAGTAEYAEAATLTQGSVNATIKRVVLESGTWTGGTAAGRLIITQPTGGGAVFAAGAATGGGACTLAGADTAITLAPDGRVRTDAFTFTARLTDKRLYGCDGVNPEFEFGDDVLVPLNTGMSAIRATSVRCHKNHLMFGYRGSLQHSAIGLPYVWSAVFGAAELGTGDEITDLVSVGGSETAAALMVLCRNALFVLYGTDVDSWQLVPLSRVSGCSPRSAQDIAGVVALDAPGFVRYPATQDFGNFARDSVSRAIDPIARGQSAECSVYVTDRSLYRCFFDDGTAVSGFAADSKRFEWTVIDYGRAIVCAEHGEIAGVSRTFYADDQGWVYEADVGRSFDGDVIEYGMVLTDLSQKSPMTLKQYRRGEVEVEASSAMELNVGAEFRDGDEDPEPGTIATREVTELLQYGNGLIYDLTNYDQAYWDVAGVARRRFPIEGLGTAASVSVAGSSDSELPHVIRAVTLFYTPRRLVR